MVEFVFILEFATPRIDISDASRKAGRVEEKSFESTTMHDFNPVERVYSMSFPAAKVPTNLTEFTGFKDL